MYSEFKMNKNKIFTRFGRFQNEKCIIGKLQKLNYIVSNYD
jgi:hypothetical protein